MSSPAVAGWEGITAYTEWLASAYADTRGQAGGPLVLASPDANLPAPVDEPTQTNTKTSGKKRSVDIVDGSGNVVSSVKQ